MVKYVSQSHGHSLLLVELIKVLQVALRRQCNVRAVSGDIRDITDTDGIKRQLNSVNTSIVLTFSTVFTSTPLVSKRETISVCPPDTANIKAVQPS